jgi:hypothetical protein
VVPLDVPITIIDTPGIPVLFSLTTRPWTLPEFCEKEGRLSDTSKKAKSSFVMFAGIFRNWILISFSNYLVKQK